MARSVPQTFIFDTTIWFTHGTEKTKSKHTSNSIEGFWEVVVSLEKSYKEGTMLPMMRNMAHKKGFCKGEQSTNPKHQANLKSSFSQS